MEFSKPISTLIGLTKVIVEFGASRVDRERVANLYQALVPAANA